MDIGEKLLKSHETATFWLLLDALDCKDCDGVPPRKLRHPVQKLHFCSTFKSSYC
jgi:hypothetical protein